MVLDRFENNLHTYIDKWRREAAKLEQPSEIE
jgi:hypothetical protein